MKLVAGYSALATLAASQSVQWVEKLSAKSGLVFDLEKEDSGNVLFRANKLCGHLNLPQHSQLFCHMKGKADECWIGCAEGFIFEDGSVAQSLGCSAEYDGWYHSGSLTGNNELKELTAEYKPTSMKCVKSTPCRESSMKCTASGNFEPLQCEGMDLCYCVDFDGKKIPGTTAGVGDETPDCKAYATAPISSPTLPDSEDWHDACVIWEQGTWFKSFDGNFVSFVSDAALKVLETVGGLTLQKSWNFNKAKTEYELVRIGENGQAGKFSLQNEVPVFVFAGMTYGQNEQDEPVILEDTFKVFKRDGAVIVIDLVENARFTWNDDSMLIKVPFNLASKGVCGSYDANPENDFTNAYGHIVQDKTLFMESWNNICPNEMTFRSSSKGEKAVITIWNTAKFHVNIKKVQPNLGFKVIEELEKDQRKEIEVLTSDVIFAESANGYKMRIDGGCVLLPENFGFHYVQEDYFENNGFSLDYDLTCAAFAPVHGSIECQKTSDNTKVCSIVCDEGYRPEGTTLFLCDLETGKYSPALPRGEQRYPSCISTARKCSHIDAPVNGKVECKETNGQLRCFPTCNEGFEFSTLIPITGYYSCMDGKWNPYPHFPECIEIKEQVDENQLGKVIGIMNKGQVPADQTGYCASWGQHHYRTFDGLMFRFQGECSYTLVKDVIAGSFSVDVNNAPNCDSEHCSRSINIYIGNNFVTLENINGEPVVKTTNDEVLNIPTIFFSLSISRVADYIIVKEIANSWTLKWDGDEAIFIKLEENMINQTGGLCGLFNHDQTDDLTSREGTLVSSVSLFANSWATKEECPNASEETFCDPKTEDGMRKSSEAIMLCSHMMKTACESVVDPTPYFEACKEDVCFSKNATLTASSPCNSMAAYFRECSRHGIHVEWRTEGVCPMECPAGQHYHPCGSSCAPSCFNPEGEGCSNEECVDGCHCPFDCFLHEGECLLREECPCLNGDQVIQPRQQLTRDCNQCVCLGGTFHCTKKKCDSVCSIINSHITTFDGTDYEFEGDCSYVAWTNGDVEVIVNNKDCSGKECTRSVIVKAVVADTGVKFIHDQIIVEGDEKVTLPMRLYRPFENKLVDTGLIIERINSDYIAIHGEGIRALWNQKDTLTFSAAEGEQFKGLCGTLNGDASDDFMTQEGDVEENVLDFVKKWQVGDCKNMQPSQKQLDPCMQYMARKPEAVAKCAMFETVEFEACFEVVDPTPYLNNCKSDYCANPSAKSSCSHAALYIQACAKQGVAIDSGFGAWRKGTECDFECPYGQVFQECGKACQRSCGALALGEIECTEQCIPGCQCEGDNVLNHEGKCVPATQCSCFYNEVEYLAGETRTKDCNICECHQGEWICTDNKCDISTECKENEEFTTCKRPTQLTCYNMHLEKEHSKHINHHCESGCQCTDGYVLDSETKTCVVAEKCPCFHGGRSFKLGESYNVECNTFTCGAEGMWHHTNNECAGSCQAYGDSHITTFDGHKYQFQGACEYVYAQTDAFKLTATNEVCGTANNVCTKSIKLTVNGATIEFSRGKPITSDRDNEFELKFAGLWVFVETKVGVTLQWNKGTHMIIKIDPKYKNQVKGLCGNFNMVGNDDFQQKDGILTASVIKFGNSWRVNEKCATAIKIEDTCALNEHRRIWSALKCSVIKAETGPFARCHEHVPYQAYYDACQFDACGCDMGGDCECLCTAIGAYAQACNARGINIAWRSQALCPMQCDGCMEYSPCVSANPKHCGNMGEWDNLESDEVCVEGCQCLEDTILTEDGTKCIPTSECFCKEIDGVKYAEGEKIESLSSECQSCYCMNNDVHCVGLQCPGQSTTVMPTTPSFGPKGTTTTAAVSTTIPECPEENKHICAFRCYEACHALSATQYWCQYDQNYCVDVCQDEEVVKCEPGQALKNYVECIDVKDCTCRLPSGEVLAPHETFDDIKSCKRYHCVNNELLETVIPNYPGCDNKCTHKGLKYAIGEVFSLGDKCVEYQCNEDLTITMKDLRDQCPKKPTCDHGEPILAGNDGCCDCYTCPCPEGCPWDPSPAPFPESCPEHMKAGPINVNECCIKHVCVCDDNCPEIDLITLCKDGSKPQRKTGECCDERTCDEKQCIFEDMTVALNKQPGDEWQGEHECIECTCSDNYLATCKDLRDYCNPEVPECTATEKLVEEVCGCCVVKKCVPVDCPSCPEDLINQTQEDCKPFEKLELVSYTGENIPEGCCYSHVCKCHQPLCTIDDSLCDNGEMPTHIKENEDDCCLTRHCACDYCYVGKERKDKGDCWMVNNGCTKKCCLGNDNIDTQDTKCSPVLEFLNFVHPAPESCEEGYRLELLDKNNHKMYACCDYGKCVPEGDELCGTPPVETTECACSHHNKVVDTETYTKIVNGKEIECTKKVEKCVCPESCPAVVKDCAADCTWTVTEGCCGCQQGNCDCTPPPPEYCTDVEGNKRKIGEEWFEDEAECFKCICQANGKPDCPKEPENSCCDVACDSPTPCHPWQQANPVIEDCCTVNDCVCSVMKCHQHVKDLKLGIECEAGYSASKTERFQDCCDYVVECSKTTTTTISTTTTPCSPGECWECEEDSCMICQSNSDCSVTKTQKTCPEEAYPMGCKSPKSVAQWGFVDEAKCCEQIVNCKCPDTPDCPTTTCPVHHKIKVIQSKEECGCDTHKCVCDYDSCPDIEKMKPKCPNGRLVKNPPNPCCESYTCETTTTVSPTTTPYTPPCTDNNQCPRVLGESWYADGNSCRVCSCCEANNIQCFDLYCPEIPVCGLNEHLIGYQVNECCEEFHCRPDKCADVQCEQPECCQFYEDSEIITKDECCQQRVCKCNPKKCPKVMKTCTDNQELVIPESTEENCCPEPYCKDLTTTTTTTTTTKPEQFCYDSDNNQVAVGGSWNVAVGSLPAHCKTCTCYLDKEGQADSDCKMTPVCGMPNKCPEGYYKDGTQLEGCCYQPICKPECTDECQKKRDQGLCDDVPSAPKTCAHEHKIVKTYLTGVTDSEGNKCCETGSCQCIDAADCPAVKKCEANETTKHIKGECCDSVECVPIDYTTTTTTTTPTDNFCINNLGEEVVPGSTWLQKPKDSKFDASCYPCTCISHENPKCEDHTIDCPAKTCKEGEIDCGEQIVGCCVEPICQTATCKKQNEKNPDLCKKYSAEGECPMFHTKTIEKTGPGNCCETKVCTCDLKKCHVIDCDEGETSVLVPDEKLMDCCPVYKCVKVTTPTPQTTTKPTYDCSCTWTNPDTQIKESHKPGADSWTHGCIEYTCKLVMEKCHLEQKAKSCPNKPVCAADEELCETQGNCCTLYHCNKKSECKCGEYQCPSEPTCNNSQGMFLSPAAKDPLHPCCDLQECTCQAEKCPEMGEKPTCTPGECETCEAIKVTKPGKCCPEWECECESSEVDNVCTYKENGVEKTIAVDEHVYITEMMKCKRCACKLTGKTAELTCDAVEQKDDCEPLKDCKPDENQFDFNFKCCPKRTCTPKPDQCPSSHQGGFCEDNTVDSCSACELDEIHNYTKHQHPDSDDPACVCYKRVCKCDDTHSASCCTAPSKCENDNETPEYETVGCCQKLKACHPKCKVGDVTYEFGETWGPKCNPCECKSGGMVSCTAVSCDQYSDEVCTEPKSEKYEVGYYDESKCCIKKGCKCPESKKCEDIHGDKCIVPTCAAGYKLDDGTALDECFTQYKCVCDSECPAVPKEDCDECCTLTTTTNECGCPTKHVCQCQPQECKHEGTTYKVGDKFFQDNDKCIDCICNDDKKVTCVHHRDYCKQKMKPMCKANEKLVLVSKTDCCEEWRCDDKSVCEALSTIEECTAAYPSAYPHPECEYGYELDSGKPLDKEGCCTEFKCQCAKECPPTKEVACAVECTETTTTNECGCEVKKCKCPPKKCEINGEFFELDTTWNHNDDVCQPCCCDAEGEGQCQNRRNHCGAIGVDDVCPEETPIKRHLHSTECCDEYECVEDKCKDHDCTVEFPDHYPVTPCDIGYKPSKKSDLSDCCSEYECICDADQCSILALLNKKCEDGCTRKFVTNDCGCEHYICDCPTDKCEVDGIEYAHGTTWYDHKDGKMDMCVTHYCEDDSTITTTDKRKTCEIKVCAEDEEKVLCGVEECCEVFTCQPKQCPSIEECEEQFGTLFPDHQKVDGVYKCSNVLYKTAPSGNWLMTLKDKTKCCQQHTCVCAPCGPVQTPACDLTTHKIVEDKNECGCITQTCVCKDEPCKTPCANGLFFPAQWNVDGDECHKCCCNEDGTETCNNERDSCAKEPMCKEGETKTLVSETKCCKTYECKVDDCVCPEDKVFSVPTCTAPYTMQVKQQHEPNCPCTEYECVCNPAMCMNKPPTCQPGCSYRTIKGDCCDTYSDCECDKPCVYDCKDEITKCDDGKGMLYPVGVFKWQDEAQCEALKCTCDAQLLTGNVCDGECIESKPVCAVGCSFRTCVPAEGSQSLCASYGTCECPTCTEKNECCPNGKKLNTFWYTDPATECEKCECKLVNGEAKEVCEQVQPPTIFDCPEGKVAHDTPLKCGGFKRVCVDPCTEKECPETVMPTCQACHAPGYTKEFTHYAGDDENCPCYKHACGCPETCPEIGTCGANQVSLGTKKDACGCCDVLIGCKDKACTYQNKEYAVGERIYSNSDMKKCYPMICKIVNGSPMVADDFEARQNPCHTTQETLPACENDHEPCDDFDGCCWNRQCVPPTCDECPEIEMITCNSIYKEPKIVFSHYAKEDPKCKCYKKQCECKDTCPQVDTCEAGCTPVYETKECGCKILKDCTCSTTTTPTVTTTIPTENVCTDHDGCLRTLGEQWHHEGDACNLCTCLENGLVSCNDRSELCQEVPICEEGTQMMTFACDECCLSYKCIPDKCYNKCLEKEQPCCQAHEKVVEIEAWDEDNCYCPRFECQCDVDLCPTYMLEKVDCGCDMCKVVLPEGNCGKGGNKCAGPPVCQCEIPTCPGVESHTCGEQGKDICTSGLLCDGENMVPPTECPCQTPYGLKKPGTSWKPDNCSTCKCVNGKSSCHPDEVCAMVKCKAGEKAVIKEGECCESCEKVDQCCEVGDNTYAIGSSWNTGCETCKCTKNVNGGDFGIISCQPQLCEAPLEECENGYVLTKLSADETDLCCQYECQCKPDTCKVQSLDCSAYECHTVKNIRENGECCGTNQCICDSTCCSQHLKQCEPHETLVKTGIIVDNCCPEYECQTTGCYYNGLKYPVGATFEHDSDSCQECECLDNNNIIGCQPKTCEQVSKPVCPGNADPVTVTDECGCPSYYCDCTCNGKLLDRYQQLSTFDSLTVDFMHGTQCEQKISYDACDNKYEVIADLYKMDDSEESPINIRTFTVKDNTENKVYSITINENSHFIFSLIHTGNAMFAKNLDEESMINSLDKFLVHRTGDTVTLIVIPVDVKLIWNRQTTQWSVTVSADYAHCTLGYCGICDDDKENDFGRICRQDKPFCHATEKSYRQAMRHNHADPKNERCHDDETHVCECDFEGTKYGPGATWKVTACKTAKCVKFLDQCSISYEDQIPCIPDKCEWNGQELCLGETIKNQANCESITCEGLYQPLLIEKFDCVLEKSDLTPCQLGEVAQDTQTEGCCWTRICVPCDDCPVYEVPVCGEDQYLHEVIFTGLRGMKMDETCECKKYECRCIKEEDCPVITVGDHCQAGEECWSATLIKLPMAENQCCPKYECQYDCEVKAEDFCEVITNNDEWDTCYGFLDPVWWKESCTHHLCLEETKECQTGEEVTYGPSCNEIAAFAQACGDVIGECHNTWREIPKYALLCPVECDAEKVFRPCGPNIPITCENMNSYEQMVNFGEITLTTEGCFCEDGKVLHKSGKCVEPWECHECLDLDGNVRQTGEWWPTDEECKIQVCMCGQTGVIMEKQVTCEDYTQVESCPAGCTKRSVTDETGCCTSSWCECECDDVECEVQEVLECPFGEHIIISFAEEDTAKCCPIKTCECTEKTCPLDVEEPTCQDYEVMVKQNDDCCCCKHCICDQEICDSLIEPPQCALYEKPVRVHAMQHMSGIGLSFAQCCGEWECECDPMECREPVDERINGECPAGMLLVTPSINESRFGQSGMTCCGTDYKCVCPEVCPDLEPIDCDEATHSIELVEGNCCPYQICKCDPLKCVVPEEANSITAAHCTANGIVHNPSKNLIQMAKGCCPAYYKGGCSCKPETCKPPTPIDCHSWERLEYVETKVGHSCCDYYRCVCKVEECPKQPSSCPCGQRLVNDLERENGPCCGYHKKCICDDTNPADLVKCDPECEIKVLKEIPGDKCGYNHAECIPKDTCFYLGKHYQPGEKWFSKDMCNQCFCPEIPDDKGYYKPMCQAECCGECAPGHIRVPQADTCCGTCIPMTCEVNGMSKNIGDQWTSEEDKCIKCECKQGWKDLYAECFSTRFVVQDCPKEFIELSEDGCVETCNMPVIETCKAESDYTGKLTVQIGGEECESVHNHNILKCAGECTSESIMKDGIVRKQCSCCGASAYESKNVEVICSSGRKFHHSVEFVTACGCASTECEAEELEIDWFEIVEDIAEDVVDKAEDLVEDAIDVVEDVVEEVIDVVDDVVDAAADAVESVAKKVWSWFG